jgi:acyl-CoA thioester hydrolase
MDRIVMWRGQVPAWECDADGRWSLRHMAGAFEEAAQVAAGPDASVDLSLNPDARPKAGAIVEIHADRADGALALLMSDHDDGAILTRARVSGTFAPPAPQLPEGATPGPIDVVRAWECDVMGHLNVQFYASRLTAAESIFAASGVAPGDLVLRPTEHRFRFAGELRAGEPAFAYANKIAGGGLTLRTELVRGDGKPAAFMESDLAPFAIAGPDVDMRAFQSWASALPSSTPADAVWSAGVWAPDAETVERMTVLGRQEVLPWEVDHTGVMPPRFFFARMASSVPFLLSKMGLERPFMQKHNLGRAAVGYRLRYLRWPRAGDCLELRSGVALVGSKNWRFRHAFIDIADGEQVCAVEAVIVLLDLAARKSAVLPDEIRARAISISI